MANMYNINSLSYTTHENPEWFTRAMFGGRLVQGGYIRVLTGIKGDELLSQIDLANKILQIDGKDCAWTPNQIIKLSEKKAKVTTYKINLEQCIDELEQKRTLYQLSPGAKNESLPDELEAATLALIAIGLSNEIEEMIIGGDSAVDPNQFDGMVKTLLNSTDAIKLVGATITKANVLGLIETGYEAIPEAVLQAEDAGTLYVMGSYATRRLIRAALSDKSNQVIAASWTVDDTDKKNPKLFYLGLEYVPVKGIGNNTLVFYDSTNAFLLTDLLSDLEEIELGSFPKPNDDKIFVKGRLRLGFVIPFEDEVVIIDPSITTASGGYDPDQGLRVVPNSLVFDAAGETKTFTVVTKALPLVGGEEVEDQIAVNAAGAVGFTVTAGETAEGVTTVTVVAAASGGNLNPRTGQVVVSLPDTDRIAIVTLNQRAEDQIEIQP
jgi:hypothetical protein